MRIALNGQNDNDDSNNNDNDNDSKLIHDKDNTGRSRFRGVVDVAGFSGQQIRTVAFPCISTGVYGFPVDEAAETAARAVRDWLEGSLLGVGGDDHNNNSNNKKKKKKNDKNDKDAATDHTQSKAAAAKKDINKAFDGIVFCVFGEADERAYKKWLP